jgi:hypothetical protein
MKLNIDSNEVKQILEMHSKLRKKGLLEQEEKVVPNQDEIDRKFLMDCETAGCLKNGEIKLLRGTTKPVYQATTLNSKEVVLFYPDKTYKFPKTGETGKWKCSKVEQMMAQQTLQQNEIEQLKTQFGWKTREDLKNVTQEELTQLYQKHPKFELYKLKVESGKIGGYTDVQQKFIDNAKKLGYKESLTSEETASGKYKQYLVPNSEQYFPGGLKMFYSSETAISSGVDIKQQFKNSVTNQTPTSKKDCRDTISAYYNAWRTKKEIPDVEFEPMKRKVQACVNEYDGKWGGILSKIDEYVDVLRGVQVGDIKGPLSSGGDSKWRLK